jgi:hypothetical protein
MNIFIFYELIQNYFVTEICKCALHSIEIELSLIMPVSAFAAFTYLLNSFTYYFRISPTAQCQLAQTCHVSELVSSLLPLTFNQYGAATDKQQAHTLWRWHFVNHKH